MPDNPDGVVPGQLLPGEEGPDDAAARRGQPDSGVDLARSLLEQARADARERGVAARRDRTGAPREAAARRSGPGADERDPQPLRRTIGRLLAERGWETSVAVGGVVGRWAEIVGPQLAAHCRPDRFADGELTVVADSTAWATQVRLLGGQLVSRLNEEVGQGTVQRVRVLGPEAPSWRKGPLRARGRGPRDTYG